MNDIRRLLGFKWPKYRDDSDYRKQINGSLIMVTAYAFVAWLLLFFIGYLIDIRLFNILSWISRAVFFICLILGAIAFILQLLLPTKNKNTGGLSKKPKWDDTGWDTGNSNSNSNNTNNTSNTSNNSNNKWDDTGWV